MTKKSVSKMRKLRSRKTGRLQPQIFQGRLVTPTELKQLRRELLTFKRRTVSDEMRELIEDIWPELAHKLPAKRPHS
jgi:CRISPR/Cas system-associated endoribonuclease Cas2